MKESYGFSALFEAMAIQERRDNSDNTIMDVACGAMEASLIGDDVVGSLGIADGDALPTGVEDYEDLADEPMDADMKRLDAALDDISESDDEDLGSLDDALESIIYE